METTDVVFDNLNYIFYFFELFIVDKRLNNMKYLTINFNQSERVGHLPDV